MRKIIIASVIVVLLGVVAVPVDFVYAQEPPQGEQQQNPPQGQIDTGTGDVRCADGQSPVNGKCPLRNPAQQYLFEFGTFDNLLIAIINVLIFFAGAIAVLFLLIGGFQYIASRGNEEAIEKAKKTITGAVIGIVIIVMAFAIVTIVNRLLIQAEQSQNGNPAANQNPGGSGGGGQQQQNQTFPNTGGGALAETAPERVLIDGLQAEYNLGNSVNIRFIPDPPGVYRWNYRGVPPFGVEFDQTIPGFSGTISPNASTTSYIISLEVQGQDEERGFYTFNINVE